MKRFIAGIVIGMVLAGGVAYAQSPNGQTFLTWPEVARVYYNIGWSAGFIGGVALTNPISIVAQRILTCAADWTGGQQRAIIEHYIRANPQEWHEAISVLSMRAILKACS